MSKHDAPKFTPEPWQAVGLGDASYFPSVRIGPKYKYEDGSGEGEDLITINAGATPEDVKAGIGGGTTSETADANALLIAAAPSLYAACQAAIDALVRMHSEDHDYLLVCDCKDAQAFRQIDAAMTLVDGGEPRRPESEATA